ncbi:MAG: RNase adapter RapZ [Thermoanaerobaculia bacterium]|nr:RNase adapter RapZ [Thermoanaerobaculia bacterium]
MTEIPPGPAPAERPQLVLITGLSGSGKSIAANAFEDLGYYVVDNLPLSLLGQYLADPRKHTPEQTKIAVVGDIRTSRFADDMPTLLSELDRERVDFVVLFLEASEEVLTRRYSETRRSHPVGGTDRPVIEGIRSEREMLAPLRDAADLVFETSDWSVHDMRRAVHREFSGEGEGPSLVVTLVSFGFKHGLPAGSDLVFDVRFLQNPYFVPGLRERTGQDVEVRDFLDSHDDFHELMDRLEGLLLFLLPRYRQENRRYLSLAVGCTGGKHRSVVVAERLAARLDSAGWRIRVSHRESDRW